MHRLGLTPFSDFFAKACINFGHFLVAMFFDARIDLGGIDRAATAFYDSPVRVQVLNTGATCGKSLSRNGPQFCASVRVTVWLPARTSALWSDRPEQFGELAQVLVKRWKNRPYFMIRAISRVFG